MTAMTKTPGQLMAAESAEALSVFANAAQQPVDLTGFAETHAIYTICLLYTSDAADE